MNPIRVMLVDDSATVRQVLSTALSREADIKIIATASDPLFAMDKMAREWPDVIVLDVEMPRMDGITFLRKLMFERPTPVVICSSLTERGAETTLQALAAGAVSIVPKPTSGLRQFLLERSAEIADAIRAAARARPRLPTPPVRHGAEVIALPASAGGAMARTTDKVVAMGASTGGTQALEAVLTALPRVCPGIVVVQHMPERFTAAFAARLNTLSAIEVREARGGERVIPGIALIAPGGRHLQLGRSGAQYHVEVSDGLPVNRHRPSVDVLFRSVARCAGRNALGIILTGMGDDGARGLKEMRDAGGRTLAQDEASCVVYGMPKEAVKLGAVERSLALGELAAEVVRHGAG